MTGTPAGGSAARRPSHLFFILALLAPLARAATAPRERKNQKEARGRAMRPGAASLLWGTTGGPPPHDLSQSARSPDTTSHCPHAAGFELLFSDAFDGTSLNTKAWVKEAGDGSAVRLAGILWPQISSRTPTHGSQPMCRLPLEREPGLSPQPDPPADCAPSLPTPAAAEV